MSKSQALSRDRSDFENRREQFGAPCAAQLQEYNHFLMRWFKYLHVSKEKQHKIITIIWGTNASDIC